jgi:hypothetical protein
MLPWRLDCRIPAANAPTRTRRGAAASTAGRGMFRPHAENSAARALSREARADLPRVWKFSPAGRARNRLLPGASGRRSRWRLGKGPLPASIPARTEIFCCRAPERARDGIDDGFSPRVRRADDRPRLPVSDRRAEKNGSNARCARFFRTFGDAGGDPKRYGTPDACPVVWGLSRVAEVAGGRRIGAGRV